MANSAGSPFPPGSPSSAKIAPMGELQRSASIKGVVRRQSFAMKGMQSSFKFSAALAEASAQEEEDGVDFFEALRVKTKKFITGTRAGANVEITLSLLNILFSLEYIYKTYLKQSVPIEAAEIRILNRLELIFAGIFVLEWALYYILADHKLLYIMSFLALVDLVTVVSIFVTFNLEEPKVYEIHTFDEAVIYAMFALNTVRILKALRIKRRLVNIEDAVQRFLGEISVNISVMILFFAAIMQFLEQTTHGLQFHTWIWFIWVTISTVGYGDISPLTTQGRIATMCIIGFSIISIPKMTNELIEKMNLQSVYARASYTPRTRFSKHIVICGDLSSTSLRDFLDELFHEDHENSNLNAVLLLPTPPSVEIVLLTRDQKFFLQVSYLEGSALVDNDLKRARTEDAVAVFIMTNKFSPNPDQEDAKSILLSFSLKRYIANFNVAPKLYCMQLIRPQNRRHLGKEEVETRVSNNLIVCLNEFKMGIMSKAVMYPGANTLLMNLISSFSDDPLIPNDDEEEAYMDEIDPESGISSKVIVRPWMQEYEKGCDWEIYTSPLARIFVGAKFSELSFALYQKFGVVLFALQITDTQESNQTRILLNPAKFVIPDGTRFSVLGFVMAQNKASSDLTFHDSISTGTQMGQGPVDNNLTTGMTSPRSGGDSRTQIFPTKLFERLGQTTISHSSATLDRGNSVGKAGLERGNSVSKERPSHRAADTIVMNAAKRTHRANSLDRAFESLSYQEILHKLKDNHFSSNYYLRQYPADIADCIVKTSVRDVVPDINEHVIIVGKYFSNLFDLVKPLRAKYAGALKYIVILSPNDIPHDIWQRISMFDAILVVKGSMLEERNLRRAGVFRAQRVLVLSNQQSDPEDTVTSSGMKALVDSDAIFSFQRIRRMNPHCQVVVEIINTSNIRYIDKEQNTASIADYRFSSQFAAGTLFTTSLLDSIICQAYYNPHIVQVMQKLISGVDQLERDELIMEAAEHAEARMRLKKKRRKERQREKLRRRRRRRQRRKNREEGGGAEGGEGDDSSSSDDSDDEDEGSDRQEADDDGDDFGSSDGDEDNDYDDDSGGEGSEDLNRSLSERLKKGSSQRSSDEENSGSSSFERRGAAGTPAGIPRRVSDIQGSCLYQMALPPSMEKQTYGELYQYLSVGGLIPLGLLRGLQPGTKRGPKGNKLPYVYTNPSSDTALYPFDRIFVLSTKPIDRLNIGKGGNFMAPAKAGMLKQGFGSIVGMALSKGSTDAASNRVTTAASASGDGTVASTGSAGPFASLLSRSNDIDTAAVPAAAAAAAAAANGVNSMKLGGGGGGANKSVDSAAYSDLMQAHSKLEAKFQNLSNEVKGKLDSIIAMLGNSTATGTEHGHGSRRQKLQQQQTRSRGRHHRDGQQADKSDDSSLSSHESADYTNKKHRNTHTPQQQHGAHSQPMRGSTLEAKEDINAVNMSHSNSEAEIRTDLKNSATTGGTPNAHKPKKQPSGAPSSPSQNRSTKVAANKFKLKLKPPALATAGSSAVAADGALVGPSLDSTKSSRSRKHALMVNSETSTIELVKPSATTATTASTATAIAAAGGGAGGAADNGKLPEVNAKYNASSVAMDDDLLSLGSSSVIKL